MTTTRRNYGPFRVVARTIRAKLEFGWANLRCGVQIGRTPLGRRYRTAPQWFVRFDGSPCAAGPFTADSIRRFTSASPMGRLT